MAQADVHEGGPQGPEGTQEARTEAPLRLSRDPMDEGFPKEERVRRSEDFTRILRDGHRAPGRYVTAHWLASAAANEENRVGIAVGKKLGDAAVRNRVKRRIRESYRRNKRELPCRGLVIILRASRDAVGRSTGEIAPDVVRVLRAIANSA
jgi:ribonuclease P protein component